MKLFDIIDGLFFGSKYLVWGLSLLGILGSLILLFINISLGFASAAVFIATFFLALGVTILLLPKKLVQVNKRYIIGAISLAIALGVIGVVYVTNGGFPQIDLIFI
jgi:hypothetical protein